MLEIENTAVWGIGAAIRAMRNPLQSWEKSDSEGERIGENDLALASRLVRAGNDHGKFARMISVSCDITAPVYWWQEMDTYKVGTVRNSCSLQHTGAGQDFGIEDFSLDGYPGCFTPYLACINEMREMFVKTGDYRYFRLMRQLLPMGYNYRATWSANYQVLRSIYCARRNHKLSEWHEFCEWIDGLPYAAELICVGGTKDE